MKAISIVYHDVLHNIDPDSSGFPGAGPGRYKLDYEEFKEHLKAISCVQSANRRSVMDFMKDGSELAYFLTFDDGGSSAATVIADLLEKFGWIGHFFITTNRVNTPGFMTDAQIRELRNKGHVIGSHSASHPTRMSHCSWEALCREWSDSVQALSDILQEPVFTASVPGGFYSRRVAESADVAGIKALFTSEPVTRCHFVGDCLVLGRFKIMRGMPHDKSARFFSPRSHARVGQRMFWALKKTAKMLGGKQYLKLRQELLKRNLV